MTVDVDRVDVCTDEEDVVDVFDACELGLILGGGGDTGEVTPSVGVGEGTKTWVDVWFVCPPKEPLHG